MKNILYENLNYQELLSEFHDCFNNGFLFEDFLRQYLFVIGLDEVQVTKKTGDGGIDLIAKRRGIGDFSDYDAVDYYVQAKRYKPSEKISPNLINELRGAMTNGSKGLFIATCDYSKSAVEKANDKRQADRPIVLVNGKDLITSCIEHEFCFDFVPTLNKIKICNAIHTPLIDKQQVNKMVNTSDAVDKLISYNDIRARILRLPKVIKDNIDFSQKELSVIVNGNNYTLTIYNSGEYLARVTDIYKKYNLILDDGRYNPKIVKMLVKDGVLNIIINE